MGDFLDFVFSKPQVNQRIFDEGEQILQLVGVKSSFADHQGPVSRVYPIS